MNNSTLFKGKSPELMALTDPINLQTKILDNFIDKVNATSNGKERCIITDGHNVFNYLVEVFSTTSAELAIAAHHELARQDPRRAQTSEDLDRHTSDYDYVNFYSTPSPFIFQFTLDKNHMFAHAEQYNNFYSKVIIPKNTVFTLGKYDFGIHYPIEIRLNKMTRNVMAIWDTSEKNPLQELDSNVIELYEHEYQGQEYVSFLIPVQQFSRVVLREALVSGHGFTKSIKYDNKFYACRLYTEVNGETIELSQTFSDTTYDPMTPTARLYLESERNVLKINIPQIYFTRGQLGNYLRMEIFTTHGKLDLDVTNLTEYKTNVKFNLKDVGPTDVKYSKILETNPHKNLKLTQTKLSGGSDGITFEEKRKRVIHNSFHTSVTVTQMDFRYKFQDSGFKVEKHLDNLTKRIYYAYKLLTDGNGSIVHTKNVPIMLTDETPNTTSTIVKNIDQSMTILPTTIYEYSPGRDVCEPLNDSRLNYLKLLDDELLIDEMNSHVYTKSPFHIRLITNNKYVRASSYNLMTPVVDRFMFLKENQNTTMQMTTAGGRIVHLGEGSGGYRIQLLVKKTNDLLEIPEEYLTLYVYAMSLDGVSIGTTAKLVGTYQDQFVYEFNVDSDYWIDTKDGLSVTNLSYPNSIHSHTLPLQSKFYAVFMVDSEVTPGVRTDESMFQGVPETIKTGKTCLIRQSFIVTFGENIDDTIYNDIDLIWQGSLYKLHEVDVPLTYDRDIYETDSNGVTVFEVVDGEVKMNLLHAKGDLVLDDHGEQMYLHKVGDVVIGTDGQPVILKDRVLTYYLRALMIDAKIYVSEHPTQIKFRNGIISTIMSYINFLREESKHLLEQTELFFRPVNTLGNAKFHIGNDVIITQALAGTYRFRCHVPKYVLGDLDLQQTIEESLTEILEEYISGSTVSLTEISNHIQSRMSEYIKAIDVLGINGRQDLQTMTIVTTDSQPSVANKLHLNKDGIITVKKHVDVEFVSE